MVRETGGSGEVFKAEMGDMKAVADLADWATSRDHLDAVGHCAAKFTYGAVSTERFADWIGLSTRFGGQRSGSQRIRCLQLRNLK